MPGPLGQQPRSQKFLLRMTDQEDAFVRSRARTRSTSLNDAITSLIQDAMAAEAPPTPPTPAPTSPAPRRRRLREPQRTRDLPPPDPIPGQTAITDPDQ